MKTNEKVSLYAVSIDSAEKSLGLIEKIDKDGGKLEFQLLSDPNHQTIDKYGLFDPAYVGKGVEGIPHPAVYLLDKNRKVLWSKIESDYRNRPTNEEIRAELNKINR